MENEEREGRGMTVIWKRLMALAVFLLVLSMLDSDGVERESLRIPIGYSAEGGSRLVGYGLEEDRFENQNFIPVIYMYDNEAEMMDALAEEVNVEKSNDGEFVVKDVEPGYVYEVTVSWECGDAQYGFMTSEI